MRNYKILKNGFAIMIAKGKKQAISRIEKCLQFEGSTEKKKWNSVNGEISLSVGEDTFTIIEDKGE